MFLLPSIQALFLKHPAVFVAADSYNMPKLINRLQVDEKKFTPVFLSVKRTNVWGHLLNLLRSRGCFFVNSEFRRHRKHRDEVKAAIKKLIHAVQISDP